MSGDIPLVTYSVELLEATINKQVERIEKLEAALREMLNTFRPFTLMPVGAPNSTARLDQEHQADVYKRAQTALKPPVP